MSKWIGAIAGNVESLLDRVDQVAGHALHKEQLQQNASPRASSQWQAPPAVLQVSSSTYSPFLSPKGSASADESVSPAAQSRRSSSGSSSRRNEPTSSQVTVDPVGCSSGNAKDSTEQELLDYLNNPSLMMDESEKSDGRSSSASSRSRKTPDSVLASGADVAQINDVNADAVEVSNGRSSGYHSSTEDNGVNQPYQISSTEDENQLLRSEINSLNQELQSMLRRLKTSAEELSNAQRKLETQNRQLSESEQISRDLQSRESDLQEMLATKDTQLGVLRMRLNEADKLVELEKQRVADLQLERDRILNDHSSSAGFHSQALDTLQAKLNDVESSLRQEVEEHRKTREEMSEKLVTIETEKQRLSTDTAHMLRSLEKEKAYNADLASQLKSIRHQSEISKQELMSYKEKAARILQSKEKLITSLKEGSMTSAGKPTADTAALISELDSLRQERDVLQDELRSSHHTVENLRTEITEVENQLQQESDASREQINSLEDQLQAETRRRDDAEIEVSKQKQELRYVHEELLKQKTAFQNRLQDRDNEISRLRTQLTTKSLNASSQEELENRLHSLTETLIQKQAMLEALSTEKSSLTLQLERVEKQRHEAEASALRATSAHVTMSDSDETRQRLPEFMNESPFDGRVTRRVKMAANVIDKFSIRLGVFLRRYPIARLFIILYMFLLHLWVMIVLLTYQPEIHGNMAVPHENP